MTPEIRTALAMWENATINAHGGNARKTPLLTAAQLIEAGDKLAELVRAGTDNRQHSGRPEDQEITMNNDDERDYAEEQYNRHLLDDETDPEEDDMFSRYAGQGSAPLSRSGHRTAAMHRAGMAERSDPEFVPGLGFAALTHAVLALSAPDPEEGTWRQRAIEAEAALTAIGGIVSACASWAGTDPNQDALSSLSEINRVLREAGRQADRLVPRQDAPAGPGAGLTPADVDALVITAGEMWDPDGDGADEALSERQREVLAKAREIYNREYEGEGLS